MGKYKEIMDREMQMKGQGTARQGKECKGRTIKYQSKGKLKRNRKGNRGRK
jgi:hypothetical protein